MNRKAGAANAIMVVCLAPEATMKDQVQLLNKNVIIATATAIDEEAVKRSGKCEIACKNGS